MSEELSILLVESRAVTRNRARLEENARVAAQDADAKDVNIVRALTKAKSGVVLGQGDGLLLHDEVIRLREQLAAIDTLHKQWVIKFLSGYERSKGVERLVDAIGKILHPQEGA
jgi:hypothetical protein